MSQLFLTAEEVAELTGIANGRNGKTREMLQLEWLREKGIAHIENARKAPVVYRAQFLGVDAARPKEKKPWQPKQRAAA